MPEPYIPRLFRTLIVENGVFHLTPRTATMLRKRNVQPNRFFRLPAIPITAIFFLAGFCLPAVAQVTLNVTVNSGSAATTCTDGFIGGSPDPQWRVNIENQGWTTYPTSGICFTNPPNTQYSETFTCASSYPSTIQVCYRAFEDDGAACVVSQSCLEEVCQNYATPAAGGSVSNTLTIANCCGNTSSGSVNFTIAAPGSFISVPTNNNICNAISIAMSTTLTGNNTCATVETSEVDPSPGSISPSNTVWYKFIAPSSGHVTVSTDFGGTTFDTEIAVYHGTASTCAGPNWGTLTEIDSDDDIIAVINLNSEVDIECLVPGDTYYIQVDGNDASDFGSFQIRVTPAGPALPSNDLICNAINLGTLTLGGNITSNGHSNICAGTQGGEPVPSSFAIEQTVWFTFTTSNPTGANTLVQAIDNGTDDIDLQVALYESSNGTCTGTLTEVDSDYDPVFLDEDLDLWCLDPGKKYYLQVDGLDLVVAWWLLEGDFGLSIADDGNVAGPDLVCNATPLGTVPSLGSVTAANQNNYCADTVLNEPDPSCHGIDKTVWYSFKPPPSGSIELELVTLGADNIDIQVSVWESSNDSCTGFFSEVDCYDHPVSMSITGTDKLRVKCLDTSKTYFIQVDGADWPFPLDVLVEGLFDLTIYDYNVTAAPHDSICQAISLGTPTTTPTYLPNQHNFCADNILEPYPNCFGTNQTVWYTFTAPATGRVNVYTVADSAGIGDYIDLQIAIYESSDGTCNGQLSMVQCDYNDILDILMPHHLTNLYRDEDAYITCLNPGQQYWMMIDGSDDPDDVDGFFDILIEEEPGPPPITNDSICDAVALGQVPSGGNIQFDSLHNFCATVEAGEPVPSTFGLDHTVWFTFKAPGSGNVTIDADNDPLNFGDNIDLQLAVYESNNNLCTGLLNEADSDYDIIFLDETLTLTCLDSGRIYFLQVDGADWPIPANVMDNGYFGLTITDDGAFPFLPTNDSMCNAINLGTPPPGGSTATLGSGNYCAFEEAGEDNVSGGNNFFDCLNDETVWFYFTTGNTPGTTTIDILNASGIDANLGLYSAGNGVTCNFNDITLIAVSDPLFSLNNSYDLVCPKPNSVYYVQVDGLDCIFDYGTFDINVKDDGIPISLAVNDSICNAVDLDTVPSGSFTIPVSGHNMCAGEESNEPNVSGAGLLSDPNYDETVWFTFNTSAAPGLVSVEVFNTVGLNANVTVYSVNNFPSCTFSDLVEVDSKDDFLSAGVILDLSCLQPNSTYYVQVDGVDLIGDNGTFDIHVTDDGNPNVYAANDDICNASNLGNVPAGGSTATTSGHNFCTTEESNEPNVSGGQVISANSYDETIWYSFTTSATPGKTTIQVNNTSGIDANIAVFAIANPPSCNYADLTEIANADDLFSANVSIDLECLKPSMTYYVQLDGFDIPTVNDQGTFDIFVTDDGNANIYSVHDSICNAIALGVVASGGSSAVVSSGNFCSTEEAGEPNVSGGTIITSPLYDETVWFTFVTGGNPGTVTVDITNASGIQSAVSVYALNTPASCSFSDLAPVRQGIALVPGGNLTVELVCLDPNSTYFIQLDGVDVLGDMGTFDIQVSDDGTPVSAPANDSICFSISLGNPTGGSVSASNMHNNCAAEEANEPGVNGNDETVWFDFAAPLSGQATVDINSIQYIDANFSIHHAASASCDFDSLTQIGGNHDDILSFSVSFTEECLIPGETYFIQVDGADLWGDYGDFDIIVTDANPGFAGPANDPCTNATAITVGTQPCQASGMWTTYNYGTPTVSKSNSVTQACGDNCGDTWYSFTIPASGTALVEGNDEYGFLNTNNSQVTVIAWAGPCTNLQFMNCDQGGLSDDVAFYVNGNPGQTVFLQVFDDGGDDFNETFGLCVSDRCGADSCQYAQQMVPGVPYCFDTDGATAETKNVNPGYWECGDGSDPEFSVYFTYINTCPYFQMTVTANIGGICLLGEPTDGLSISLYTDSTVCDWKPDTVVDCQQTDACLGNTYYFNKAYGPFPAGTQFMIQLEGVDINIPGFSGGDNNGTIQIDETCILPIALESFTGHNEYDVNILEWETSDAAITSGFVVERSTDGMNFLDIGEVLAGDVAGGHSGGSPSIPDLDLYRFADESPFGGLNYYRLRKIDLNGDFTYSEVIVLEVADVSLQILEIWPNPASNSIHIDLAVPASGEYRIAFTDMFGKEVLRSSEILERGKNTLTFEIDRISSGVYLVEVGNLVRSQSVHGKFVKN